MAEPHVEKIAADLDALIAGVDEHDAGKPKFAGPVTGPLVDPILNPRIEALAAKLWPKGGKLRDAGVKIIESLISKYTP